jgi:hypothetical protein
MKIRRIKFNINKFMNMYDMKDLKDNLKKKNKICLNFSWNQLKKIKLFAISMKWSNFFLKSILNLTKIEHFANLLTQIKF